ncbi:class I SAM-dependent methyltransferase [Lactococcus insecticola]|uniref:SAM-dependent methyltransferase n=1 Tax=Pseudolactococcus insecticola TaxID=2709158 RepID=A0A6A0B5K4_9LACT|nr:class I SAM-dependent methyltransferase [Lactococcus insecticola]GFH39973.1 SAM-dependent methyltransferase [Lactococcus insecticola]
MSKNYEKLSQAYYDQHAKKFDRSFDGFLAGFFKRYIVKHLTINKPRARVLDVGSATGQLLAMLSEKQEIFGIGLDISPEMTRFASGRYPQFEFLTGSAMQLPFDDQSLDVIVCSASFHHFPSPETFLKEAMRTLKTGGKLVIAEIRIPLVRGLYNRYIERFSSEGDVKVYDFDTLYKLLSEAGFVLINGQKHLQIQYFEAHKKS